MKKLATSLTSGSPKSSSSGLKKLGRGVVTLSLLSAAACGAPESMDTSRDEQPMVQSSARFLRSENRVPGQYTPATRRPP